LTRTVRLPHAAEEQNSALIVELRRTIAAASNQPSGGPASRALILGNTAHYSQLAARVEKELDIPSQVIGVRDLIACSGSALRTLAEDDGSFAAVIGGLGLSGTPLDHLIDFANPHRRPEPVKDPRRKYVISGVAAAAVLFVIITILVLFGQRRAEVNRLQAEFDRLSDNAEARDLLIGKVDLIDRWKRGDVNWLEELLEISNRFPLPDEAIVGGFSASSGSSGDEASIAISGMISEPRVENDIVNELRDRPYVVSQGKSSPVTDHKLFQRSFDLQLGIPLAGRNVDQLLGIGSSAPKAEIEPSPEKPATPAATSDSGQMP
jgi:hypothetical protein